MIQLNKLRLLVLAVAAIALFGCTKVSDGTHTVSGRVSLCDPGFEGVELTISNERYGTFTTTTDEYGHYSFYEAPDGDYTVTPGKDGFTFTPASREITVSGGDVENQDFITIITWSAEYGRSAGLNAKAYQIIPTTDCGYAAAGFREMGPGNYDMWVLKLDRYGDIVWEYTFDAGGSELTDIAYSIRQTTDGGYVVAGETTNLSLGCIDLAVLKLNSAGELQWTRVYGGDNFDGARSIVETSDSGFFVAGYTDSYSTGLYDYWLLKLDEDGTMTSPEAMAVTYGYESRNETAYAARQCFSGGAPDGYVVAGTVEYERDAGGYPEPVSEALVQKVNIDFTEVWSNQFGAENADETGFNADNSVNTIEQTSDDGYILTGWTDYTGLGVSDLWVVKLTSGGEKEWEKSYDAGYTDRGYSIKQVSGGGYIAAGSRYNYEAGDYDFWILKLDGEGELQWDMTYNGNDGSEDEIRSICQTQDGGYVFTGNTQSFTGEDYVIIMKLDSSGQIPVNYRE